MTGPAAVKSPGTAAKVAVALREARERTLSLVASVSDDDLERVHSELMSPLVWDLGHIAAFEDLWLVHRFSGEPLLREDLVEIYDAFETPRARRGDLSFLKPVAAREYLAAVHARVVELIGERGLEDDGLHQMVLRHEHQHNETMLQTLELARLPDYELDGLRPTPSPPDPALGGFELVEVPAGECTIGAPASGFAYDNERPRHRVDVPTFGIGRVPVTNASFLAFAEGGGYERREWWSAEGWAWKEQYDIRRPSGWTAELDAEWRLGSLEPLDPHRPVVHVSWFEADAFARAHGVRLPTELEWEKAATWDQERRIARAYPWGETLLVPGIHANVDQLGGAPAPAGAYPCGASPYGCLGMIGDVWEWTSSDFRGYPRFVAYPYKEYSEVFFGPDYKMLRGGSWATRPPISTPTFRNWDYPQRRQIFAGIRIAADA